MLCDRPHNEYLNLTIAKPVFDLLVKRLFNKGLLQNVCIKPNFKAVPTAVVNVLDAALLYIPAFGNQPTCLKCGA